MKHDQTEKNYPWIVFYWNKNIVILMKFLSLVALEVVNMTTSSAASDENFVKMTTFVFQCHKILYIIAWFNKWSIIINKCKNQYHSLHYTETNSWLSRLKPYTKHSNQSDRITSLLSGKPDYFGRNKILSGYDLSHYQVPHCIKSFLLFCLICVYSSQFSILF